MQGIEARGKGGTKEYPMKAWGVNPTGSASMVVALLALIWMFSVVEPPPRVPAAVVVAALLRRSVHTSQYK